MADIRTPVYKNFVVYDCFFDDVLGNISKINSIKRSN